MWQEMTLLMSGLVLFIYGLMTMSSSLRDIVSSEIKKHIRSVMKNPLYGVLVGFVVTAIIQSSSATTVMTLGLVDAGILTFYQSLGIIFGANIGTTITAQLVAFKLTKAAPYIMIIGLVIWLLSNGRKKKIGLSILSFGILFFGLSLMESSLEPLKNSEFLMNIFTKIKNPFLAIFASAIATAIIQSSSVTTSMVVLLGRKGLIDIYTSIPLILGANIGTCITAMIASIGTGKNARRSAFAHLFFNIIGVAIFFPFMSILADIVKFIGGDIGHQIANAHTVFNVVNTLIFLSIIKWYYNFIKRLVPGKEIVVDTEPKYLKKTVERDPSLALNLVSKELLHQGSIALKMVRDAMNFIFKADGRKMKSIEISEDAVDELQKEITKYLVNVSQSELSKKEAQKISSYSMIVNDIERIADHATNLAELAEFRSDNDIKFSRHAIKELKEIYNMCIKNVSDSLALIKKFENKKFSRIMGREEAIDKLVLNAQISHINRLKKRLCDPAASTIYTDILNNLERISDHSVNIAEHMKEINDVNGK